MHRNGRVPGPTGINEAGSILDSSVHLNASARLYGPALDQNNISASCTGRTADAAHRNHRVPCSTRQIWRIWRTASTLFRELSILGFTELI